MAKQVCANQADFILENHSHLIEGDWVPSLARPIMLVYILIPQRLVEYHLVCVLLRIL